MVQHYRDQLALQGQLLLLILKQKHKAHRDNDLSQYDPQYDHPVAWIPYSDGHFSCYFKAKAASRLHLVAEIDNIHLQFTCGVPS